MKREQVLEKAKFMHKIAEEKLSYLNEKKAVWISSNVEDSFFSECADTPFDDDITAYNHIRRESLDIINGIERSIEIESAGGGDLYPL